MKDIFDVILSERAEKDLRKIPLPIVLKLESWINDVGHRGLMEVRKVPGYHDEPLKGERSGQRSIRLNKAYRAIYIENEQKEIVIISIIEVNKHDY